MNAVENYLFWSVSLVTIFFFLKAVFMKTILKWEIISFGGWKNKVTFSRNLFTWNFNEGMGECVRVT